MPMRFACAAVVLAVGAEVALDAGWPDNLRRYFYIRQAVRPCHLDAWCDRHVSLLEENRGGQQLHQP
eukprot:scaffold443_cov125-Cylindrotheca_fusiformis.AAC.15